ncbi:MAG: Sir2 silent information regulator family NAD-dependent deacetylase [Subdoligranulum variabile]|nr:MAG: Sir2 silent information regulator family NAD-dependent deacetylase [Subdoligranulum variabile]
MFSKTVTGRSTTACCADIARLRRALDTADAIVIGAGAGLSASAGYTYDGARFHRYFEDFIAEYGFRDMYSGGFYPFETPEEHWAYWSRYIYINRYLDAPKPVYQDLLQLVQGRDYFVLTTNVDHCFQKAGFDKQRLFYTQGDYGLWQCSRPCCQKTYDNEAAVKKMVAQQRERKIPRELVPHCPVCGAPMTMNLRADDTFVEDAGWHAAARRYEAFLHCHAGQRVLFLELGVGGNTPGIIKYPFWRMTRQNPQAVYACMNLEPYCPEEIAGQALCIAGDIGYNLHEVRLCKG